MQPPPAVSCAARTFSIPALGYPMRNALLEDEMTRKINVLLVDDSRTVLAQLERILGDIEDVAIVGLARNGAAAIRMTNESMPDLVLMDIVMPGLDGLSALRTIKSMHPEMRVAMVSSISGDSSKAEEAFKLGACQVLGKPFDVDLIESLIENVRNECSVAPAESN
jgi:two-component system chemotaxis response regulator CheY